MKDGAVMMNYPCNMINISMSRSTWGVCLHNNEGDACVFRFFRIQKKLERITSVNFQGLIQRTPKISIECQVLLYKLRVHILPYMHTLSIRVTNI